MSMEININGLNYSIDVIGKGEPLLLLHGFTGSKKNWAPFYEQWKNHFQLIAIDLPGHGKTDHPEAIDRYSVKSVIYDLETILDELNIKEINVLGYSMGGRLALSYTVLWPKRIKALILESASPGLKSERERIERKEKDEQLAKMIEEKGIKEFVEYWRKIPLFQTQKQLPKEVYNQLWNERLNNHPLGLANSLRGMGTGVQPSWWDYLTDIKVPVLIIVGEWDQKFYLIGKEMAEKMKNSQFVVIPNAGHATHVENPKIFGKIVLEFLING